MPGILWRTRHLIHRSCLLFDTNTSLIWTKFSLVAVKDAKSFTIDLCSMNYVFERGELPYEIDLSSRTGFLGPTGNVGDCLMK